MSPTDRGEPKSPAFARRDNVVETIHGVRVEDPYRWLEDGQDAEVKAWQAAQTERTERVLAAVPGRDAIRDKIERFVRIGAVEPPLVVGSKLDKRVYFHRRQAKDEDHPVLYVRECVHDARVTGAADRPEAGRANVNDG